MCGVSVSPGAEGNEQVSLPVESHVTVHHGTDSDGSQVMDLYAVFLENILAQVGIAVLQSSPDCLQTVCPQSVYQLVFPLVTALRNGVIVFIDQDAFDSCGPQFDT